MNQKNNFQFNTEPLLNKLNNVVQTELNNLLNDFITNYKLYEETHNCIMNLPSVKREISKSIETYKIDENYDDMPDLISMSSDDETDNETNKFNTHTIFYNNEEKPCDSYTRIQVQDDLDEELNDTILFMKKVENQLLKEKEDITSLFQQEINSYKEIIEKCNNEITELKKQLNSGIKVCDLTNDEEEIIENIEIKVEKENIILHIEEETNVEVEEDQYQSEEEEDQSEEEEDQSEEVEEEDQVEEDQVEEDQVEEDQVEEDQVEEDQVEEDQVEEVEQDQEEEVINEEADEDVEEVVEEDEVETEEEAEEEEEEELFEIEIDDVTYCTNDEENGFIYEIDKDGTVGDVIGHFKDSEPFFD